LSRYGLPRPSAPYSQFLRTATVPIVDVGFVDALRGGLLTTVPAVVAAQGRTVELADGSRISPDAIVAATGYHPGLEPMVGHLGVLGEHGIPRSQPGLYFAAISVRLSGLLREAARDGRRIANAVAAATPR
jgi:hypothetical protein